MIEAIIKSSPHPDHTYRKCLGLLRLATRYGEQRLEAGCQRALALGAIGYQSVKNLLGKGLESAELPEDEPALPMFHDNIRGQEYFAEGGVQ